MKAGAKGYFNEKNIWNGWRKKIDVAGLVISERQHEFISVNSTHEQAA